jgi:glycosidase
MQWEPEPRGGFTEGEPWLGLTDPEERSVAGQRGREGSLLELHRELIALRRELDGEFELVDAAPSVVAFRRGAHTIALNLGDAPAPLPPGEVRLETGSGAAAGGRLAPFAGVVLQE